MSFAGFVNYTEFVSYLNNSLDNVENVGSAYCVAGKNELFDSIIGATGPTGSIGLVGRAGTSGATGPKGVTGPTGSSGATGAVGMTGPTGSMGFEGMSGATGSTGLQGATGAMGNTGLRGGRGVAGTRGTIGVTGSIGATGAVGSDVRPDTFISLASSLITDFPGPAQYPLNNYRYVSATNTFQLQTSAYLTRFNDQIYRLPLNSAFGGREDVLCKNANNGQGLSIPLNTNASFNTTTGFITLTKPSQPGHVHMCYTTLNTVASPPVLYTLRLRDGSLTGTILASSKTVQTITAEKITLTLIVPVVNISVLVPTLEVSTTFSRFGAGVVNTASFNLFYVML